MRIDSPEFKWVFGKIADMLIKDHIQTRRQKETDQTGPTPEFSAARVKRMGRTPRLRNPQKTRLRARKRRRLNGNL
jgi:2-iminoacetate synthase ThiH